MHPPPPFLLTSVWQNKTRSSRRWYQVNSEFLQKTHQNKKNKKNWFEEVPQPSNLIWVQIGSRQKGLPWAIDWSRCAELVSARLDSTWPSRTVALFIGLHQCVCVCVYLSTHVCMCVYYVFAHSPRGEFVLSAPQSIHQGWYFQPFHIQTKHSATRAIYMLRDAAKADLCDLSVTNYAIVTLTHWFGMLPFF